MLPLPAITLPGWLPGLLRSRWLHYGLLALACGLLWLRGNHYERDRDAWRHAHAAQKHAYVAAQAAAEANEILMRTRHANQNEAANAAIARAREAGRAAGLAAADRYAAAHRVRAEAACRAPGGTDAAALPDPARRPDGDAGSADMVALSREDFDRLTGAALLAAEKQRAVEALIDAGLALPEVEFGPRP